VGAVGARAQMSGSRGGGVRFIDEVRVTPSTRRFNRWNFARTLVWTNPSTVLPFRRKASVWRGWYRDVPRRESS
jgi:hypothetical protein